MKFLFLKMVVYHHDFVGVWIILLFLLVAWFIYYYIYTSRPAPVDRILFNGPIISMEDDKIYEAVGIRGDTIAIIGNIAEVFVYEGPNTIITNLRGKAVLPGFIDTNSRFPYDGYLTNFFVDLNPTPFAPPATGANTIDIILERLQEQIPQTRPNDWIVGFGYDPNFLPPDQALNRALLDTVSVNIPIWVIYRTGDSGVGNSALLDLMGITNNPPSAAIPGGRIIRNDEGQATGLLQMQEAFRVNDRIPIPETEDNLEAAIIANRRYLAQGFTTAQNSHADQLVAQLLNSVTRLGIVQLRMVISPQVELTNRILAQIFQPNFNNVTVFQGPTNMIADGTIQYYTAYLTEPYLTPPPYTVNETQVMNIIRPLNSQETIIDTNNQLLIDPVDLAGYRGYLGNDQESFRTTFYQLHQDGINISVTVTGEAAIDFVLKTISQAQLLYPRPQARHILAHAVNITPAQLQLAKDLNLTISFFSTALYYWGNDYEDIYLGRSRTESLLPTATATDLSLNYTIHNDAPATPINGPELLWSAAYRSSLNGTIYNSQQRLLVNQALRALTINAAYSYFLEGLIGSLAYNKYADMIIVDQNPYDMDISELNQLKIVETIVGGQSYYVNPDF